MSDEGKPRLHADWRNSTAYESMLPFDRRAWAAQCLWRDREFAERASLCRAQTLRLLRPQPTVALATLPEEDDLAAWGAHFRPTSGRWPRSGDVAG